MMHVLVTDLHENAPARMEQLSTQQEPIPHVRQVGMQAQFPEEPTDDSKAGDAGHWVCSDSLEAIKRNEAPVDYVGKTDPAGTVVDDEMVEAASIFIASCLEVVAPTNAFASMNIESKVHCYRVHPTLNYGTPDFWARIGNTIYVKDFKYGFDFVDEYECWQMMDYAAGILDELGINGIEDQNYWIDMEIVQPRYYRASPTRSWRIRASDLRNYVNIMAFQSAKALMSDAECVSGDHCKNCTARRACPAARKSMYWAMQVSTEAVPVNLPADAVGLELDYIKRAIKALEYQETALLEYAEALITKGEVVPGYARVPASGFRQWNLDDKTMIMIGEATSNDFRSTKTITPAQAEKIGIDESFIKAQTNRPSSMKLKRLSKNSVKKVFS